MLSFRRRNAPWLFAGTAFVAFLLVFLFPVVFQGKVIAPLDILDHLMRPWSDGAGGFGVHNAMVYDAISQYLPYDWAVCQSIKADGYIGWNPYVYGGYPLLENTMLCPGDWHHQLYRFFDFWTAWDLGILLQFALAGIGIIVMLRGEGLSASAALLGAIAFAFYSQHVIWIYHRWVLGASCWFPWMVWAIRRSRSKNRLFFPLAAVFTALAFRGGSLQSCLFVALLVLCLFCGDCLSARQNRQGRGIPGTVLRYAVLSVTASLLIADVLINTVPPFLAGCREMRHYGVVQCLKRLPHLATTLFPLAFGTPQTLDVARPLGDSSIFSVRFSGLAVALLGVSAIPRKTAPAIPKIMVAASLVCMFTPLLDWFYDRSSVVFALGVAWLAAWSVDNLAETQRRFWRWCVRGFAATIAVWTVVSVAVLALRPKLATTLHSMVAKTLPATKSSRLDWMQTRADAFLDSFPPWSSQNLSLLLLAAFGLFAVWRIVAKKSRCDSVAPRWVALLVLCSFGELFFWSRTWVTFSDKPDPRKTPFLYPEREWTKFLREEMNDGGLLWVHGRFPDFDYFQQNVNAGIGIPSAQGYETIEPKTLAPPRDQDAYDPAAYAERGISHVLVLPGATSPSGLSAWQEVANDADLHLFRNPAFDSRWHAVLSDGSAVALGDEDNSPNLHRFTLPQGTSGILLAEPFHRSWKTGLDSDATFSVGMTKEGGTRIDLDKPLSSTAVMERHFLDQ